MPDATAVKPDDSHLSTSWQRTFRIFDQLEVSETSYLAHNARMKALPKADRNHVNLNWLAFLFSVVYYWSKGMVAKGFLILAFAYLVAAILNLIYPALWALAGIVPPSIGVGLSKLDYYRKRRFGESVWPFVPAAVGTWWGVTGIVIISVMAYGLSIRDLG